MEVEYSPNPYPKKYVSYQTLAALQNNSNLDV